MTEPASALQPAKRYAEGVSTFARLFTRWMDLNEWSHPTLTALPKAALDNVGWLHSSQISGLRHGKLLSPGPRTFVAIATLNKLLYRYTQEKKLIPNTTSSNNYAHPYVVLEDGQPPDTGWWVEVFCGERLPKDVDVSTSYYTDTTAQDFSNNYAKLIRKLMREHDFDIIEDLDAIIRERYPARDAERLQKLRNVLMNIDVWTPLELSNELPALLTLASSLGGPNTEELLRQSLK